MFMWIWIQEELSIQLETEKVRLAEEWRDKMQGLELQLDTVNSQHLVELDALRDSIRVGNIGVIFKKLRLCIVLNLQFNVRYMFTNVSSFQEELMAENMKRLEELTDELEKSHQAEIEELKQSITQQYEGTGAFLCQCPEMQFLLRDKLHVKL